MKEYVMYDEDSDAYVYVKERKKSSQEREYIVREFPKEGLRGEFCKKENDSLSLENIAGIMYDAVASNAVSLMTYGGAAALADYAAGTSYSPMDYAMVAFGAAAGKAKTGKDALGLAGLAGLTWLIGTPLQAGYEILLKGVDPTITDATSDLMQKSLVCLAAAGGGLIGKYLLGKFMKRKVEYSENLEEDF